ncbi:MAG TPA: hypothetical protein VGL53_29520 [Bryobacteraceae bacterium]|jgi:hypothetical protein
MDGQLSEVEVSNALVERIKVRLRRLMNEGFGGFLISITLFTFGAVFLSKYLHDYAALAEAVRVEILEMVDTRQEDSDSVKEAGLIAAALARVNAAGPFQSHSANRQDWNCPAEEAAVCELLLQFPELFEKRMDQELQAKPPAAIAAVEGETFDIVPMKKREPEYRPELAEGVVCQEGPRTAVMVPAQMRRPDGQHFSPRIEQAARLSANLEKALDDLASSFPQKKLPGSLVQAYFISPDSLLRIWSKRGHVQCEEFDAPRLWAAKDYFSYFWDNPKQHDYSTAAYIDYGGNGLVRTRCHAVELPRTNKNLPNGELLGVVCMDVKWRPDQEAILHRHLFFETARVTFALPDDNDLEHLSVEVLQNNRPHTPEQQPKVVELTGPINAGIVGTCCNSSAAIAVEKDDLKPTALDLALDMQKNSLTVEEIREGLHSELKNVNQRALLREITRIPFRGKKAFVLPLGLMDGHFDGLFLYPRSPGLPASDQGFLVIGLLSIGAALSAGVYSWRISPKATELRNRLALFRNLQVGVVLVDATDSILESNDRAEELFAKKLPKPGAPGLRLRFQHLIRDRLVANESPSADSAPFTRITTEDVDKARRSGEASAYYGLLSYKRKRADQADPTAQEDLDWLRVSATPIMASRKSAGGGPLQLCMEGIFATVDAVPYETIKQLNAYLKSEELARKGVQP